MDELWGDQIGFGGLRVWVFKVVFRGFGVFRVWFVLAVASYLLFVVVGLFAAVDVVVAAALGGNMWQC